MEVSSYEHKTRLIQSYLGIFQRQMDLNTNSKTNQKCLR